MTDVIMPQMGESIAEGTITKWLKNVGDKVDRDEPLFEISTDKVDAEIPAPASGVLKEIRVEAGATVAINTVVGIIGAAGEAVSRRAPPRAPRSPPLRSPCRLLLPSRPLPWPWPRPPPPWCPLRSFTSSHPPRPFAWSLRLRRPRRRPSRNRAGR